MLATVTILLFSKDVKNSMDTTIKNVEDKLNYQAAIRQKKVIGSSKHIWGTDQRSCRFKTTLRRLRSIIESVEKMEQLLQIDSLSQESADVNSPSKSV